MNALIQLSPEVAAAQAEGRPVVALESTIIAHGMMIDFALDAQRNQGLTPAEAIREACELRFRPIMPRGRKMLSVRNCRMGLPLTFSTMAPAMVKLVLLYCHLVPGSKSRGLRAH